MSGRELESPEFAVGADVIRERYAMGRATRRIVQVVRRTPRRVFVREPGQSHREHAYAYTTGGVCYGTGRAIGSGAVEGAGLLRMPKPGELEKLRALEAEEREKAAAADREMRERAELDREDETRALARLRQLVAVAPIEDLRRLFEISRVGWTTGETLDRWLLECPELEERVQAAISTFGRLIQAEQEARGDS